MTFVKLWALSYPNTSTYSYRRVAEEVKGGRGGVQMSWDKEQAGPEDTHIKLMFSWQSQQFCECCDPRNFDRKFWHVMGV